VYARVVPAHSVAATAKTAPRSRAAAKKNSSAKNPRVRGREVRVAAAAAEPSARSGISLARPPSLLSLSFPVASVTVPAVKKSALLARAWVRT
jgi:hypothetical protein